MSKLFIAEILNGGLEYRRLGSSFDYQKTYNKILGFEAGYDTEITSIDVDDNEVLLEAEKIKMKRGAIGKVRNVHVSFSKFAKRYLNGTCGKLDPDDIFIFSCTKDHVFGKIGTVAMVDVLYGSSKDDIEKLQVLQDFFMEIEDNLFFRQSALEGDAEYDTRRWRLLRTFLEGHGMWDAKCVTPIQTYCNNTVVALIRAFGHKCDYD